VVYLKFQDVWVSITLSQFESYMLSRENFLIEFRYAKLRTMAESQNNDT